MNTKNLLAVLVLLFSLSFGYFVFVYRPQEIKTKCLELASFSSPGIDTNMYGRVGEGKKIDQELFNKCLGK